MKLDKYQNILCIGAAKALTSQRICVGSPDPSSVAQQYDNTKFSCSDSFAIVYKMVISGKNFDQASRLEL